jgi:integrase/recombinase XerD
VPPLPGRVPAALSNPNVSLFRAEDRVFEAMLSGWKAQMLARGLTVGTIKGRVSLLTRFQRFTNEYPWAWRADDVDEFMSELRAGRPRGISLSTLRSYSNSISMFCSYLCDARYGWVELCESTFGDVPSQVCFEWNMPRHTAEDAVNPARRAFTKAELQKVFDDLDDVVDAEHARGSKRWLPALRDSVAFKVCYAFGLRRRELAMLQLTDFGPNPHMPAYGNFGAVRVRWGKGTAGSGPRSRTVLTSPEFDWVVALLQFWTGPGGRELFLTADRGGWMWPSEREGRVTADALGASFGAARDRAGMPSELSLHALRHSYVTHLIEAGYDPLFVQQQVGHVNMSTTSLYTSVSSDFRHRSMQRMIARRLKPTGTEEDSGG